MSDVSKMVPDLEAFAKRGLDRASQQVRRTAEEAATEAASVSSPLYGVSVQTKTFTTGDHEAKVQVTVSRVAAAPGQVFGGTAAASRAAADKVEGVASRGGFERR